MMSERTTTVARNTATEPTSGGHSQEPHLARALSNRHIQLLAIGGAIGTGLFMGSGKTISLAGPSVLFVYMIIGFMLFFVMRAMGEILLSNLNYKSFSDFAGDLLGPWAGFFTGWSYWFFWVVTGVADIVAIAGYVDKLAPGTPLWIPALLTPVVLILLNLPTVKAFGEAEFWFAIIKVVAIVALIGTGIVMIATNFTSPNGAVANLANMWNDGGMFPHGMFGFILGFQIAIFAFSPSPASNWWAPRPLRPRTRRRTCRGPSTPSPSASCSSTSAPWWSSWPSTRGGASTRRAAPSLACSPWPASASPQWSSTWWS